jgi:hypothetical protein
MINSGLSTLLLLIPLLNTPAMTQGAGKDSTAKTQPGSIPSAIKAAASKPDEDISGMYSFLSDGEFIQINLEESGVSGYISRRGDLDSDRGAFLDQFFSKAAVQGHDVTFTTRPLHGVWFEFNGRFDRGSAKSKTEDGYYILRGKLVQFITDSNKSTTSRSRDVEFKLLGQPPDETPAGKYHK